jgi:cytochrome d ubiquinol oxidase subunit II
VTGPVASLNTVWFGLIGVLWAGYFVLDGFDFGVGMLSLAIGRDDMDRRLARNAIGPIWDGNEVWLIVAGGAMFAAFPVWYASMFSGFYLVLFVVLAALILRGVSFEFRNQRDGPHWRTGWDVAMAVGSLIPAFAWGVAFTDLVHGLRLAPSGNYVGGFSGLLAPVAIVGGLASLAVFLVHGATFLSLKTAGPLADRARRGWRSRPARWSWAPRRGSQPAVRTAPATCPPWSLSSWPPGAGWPLPSPVGWYTCAGMAWRSG